MTDQLQAYRAWITGHALPAWATRGFDPAAGRFRERLDRTGAPADVPHRAMVQARQTYVYAHAAELGWFDGGALAEAAMAGLLRDFMEEAGGRASFAFSVDGRGGIADRTRDAYAHAFVLFALAALHRLNGDPRLLAVADRTIAFVDAELADAAGHLFDRWPVTDRSRRQNPHMHLLEAYLFLERAAPGRGYAGRAAALVRLFRERLFRADPGVLLEYFAPDWSPHPDAARAGLWEPGHHFEWVWLLGEHAALGGDGAAAEADTLWRVARAHGLADDGLVVDELDTGLRVVTPSRRVWPHTEAIKAAVTRHLAGDPDAPAFAAAMAGRLLEAFLDRPFAGGWIDHLAADGTPLVDYVPASSLYHLFLAAAESRQLAPA